MGFAILRTQKLKSPVAVQRSMKHALREQDTPNADPAKTPDNTHFGAQTVQEALALFNARLPEKRRKDAVLCIEYLVTASPVTVDGWSRAVQDAYFKNALEWLQARHGAENVVYAGIHRDETTPHLYAYVVPRDGDRLNCRKWLGGSKALSEMQTEFAKTVGRRHFLERGIERSNARHVPIREYYSRVNAPVPVLTSLDPPPEPKLLEGKRRYAERAVEHIRMQLDPAWRAMHGKVQQAAVSGDNVGALKKAVVAARVKVDTAQMEAENYRRVGQQKVDQAQKRIDELLNLILRGGSGLEQVRQEMLRGIGRDVEERARERSRGRGPSMPR
jgi:Plasmid recombination enzyme